MSLGYSGPGPDSFLDTRSKQILQDVTKTCSSCRSTPGQLTRQSKSLEGTLGFTVVSWGSCSGTKQVDAMAKSLTCG